MRKQTPEITLAECLAHRCSVSGHCYCHYHSQRLFLIISIFINNNSFLTQVSQIETKCDSTIFLTYFFPLDYVKIKWKLVIVLLYSGNQEIFAYEWNSYFRVPKPHSFCTENQEPFRKSKNIMQINIYSLSTFEVWDKEPRSWLGPCPNGIYNPEAVEEVG